MNRIGTVALLAMGLSAFEANALEARPSPYEGIAKRNLFQLHDPPPANVVPTPKPPLRKVALTGILTILRGPVAFITIEGIKSHPGESVMLLNGQRINGIEVKAIDERAGVVRILNEGESQILNFETLKSSGIQPDQTLMAPPPMVAPVPAQPQATLSPEAQTALIELQRIKAQMEGDPVSAILPPTELTANDKDSVAQ